MNDKEFTQNLQRKQILNGTRYKQNKRQNHTTDCYDLYERESNLYNRFGDTRNTRNARRKTDMLRARLPESLPRRIRDTKQRNSSCRNEIVGKIGTRHAVAEKKNLATLTCVGSKFRVLKRQNFNFFICCFDIPRSGW